VIRSAKRVIPGAAIAIRGREARDSERGDRDSGADSARDKECYVTRKVSFLVALAILSLARTGEGRDYQLTVNAGNEIGRVNRFWQAAVGSDHMYMVIDSARTGINLKGAYGLAASELGMKRVPGHGIFNDDVGVYHETNG
jgi:hypothetical protein